MTKHGLVTGVSTGIGRAAAEALAKKGWHVFGSVRNQADADSFKSALGDRGTPLVFDVTDRSAVEQGAAQVAQAVGAGGLDLLVNNAGISRNGPLQYLDIEDLRVQLEVNTISVVSVTQVFLSLLGASQPKRQKPGRIINISSVGGKIANPFMGPYCASKFAIEALSDSLRRELMVYGIDVVVIQPGPIKTAIWEKIDEDSLNRFENTVYKGAVKKMLAFVAESEKNGLPAEAVGKLIVKIMGRRRPKTRYVIKPGGPWDFYLMRLMPDRMLDKAVAKRLGLTG